jgi:hypothetical protein
MGWAGSVDVCIFLAWSFCDMMMMMMIPFD